MLSYCPPTPLGFCLPPSAPQPHSRQLKGSIEIQGLEKVSPPFEGGVAGIADYQIYTIFISRPGWLIY